ncbi:hypothetical protein XocVXO32_18515, partial [Xanthomonas oryzae pv. oryzicola]|uniref:hypothetical protein n=1 Tax=Xanthomonas oryzae TaxID=347 RepID=UPI003CEF2C0E
YMVVWKQAATVVRDRRRVVATVLSNAVAWRMCRRCLCALLVELGAANALFRVVFVFQGAVSCKS